MVKVTKDLAKMIALTLAQLSVAIFVTFCSWLASYMAGVEALKVTAVKSTGSILRNVEITLDLELKVPEMYLEEGYRLAQAMDVNLLKVEDSKRLMPYIHAYIASWFNGFGDIRCCTGIFVDIDWAYLEVHGNSYNNNNAFALVNVMLGEKTSESEGSAHYWIPNASTFSHRASYHTMGWMLDPVTLHPMGGAYNPAGPGGFLDWTPIFKRSDAGKGFHFQTEIGTVKNGVMRGKPDHAWWSPIYRYDIKKPYALKAECGIPLIYPYQSTTKIGAWVIGFQVSWISYFLKDLTQSLPPGTFIFLSEWQTGKYVASSDPTITGLQPDAAMGAGDWPFAVDKCHKDFIATPSKLVLEEFGTFHGVPARGKQEDPHHIEGEIKGEYSYIYVKPFPHREIQWLMFVTIPEQSILEDIRNARKITLPISLGIGVFGWCCQRILKEFLEVAKKKRSEKAASSKGGQAEGDAAPTGSVTVEVSV